MAPPDWLYRSATTDARYRRMKKRLVLKEVERLPSPVQAIMIGFGFLVEGGPIHLLGVAGKIEMELSGFWLEASVGKPLRFLKTECSRKKGGRGVYGLQDLRLGLGCP